MARGDEGAELFVAEIGVFIAWEGVADFLELGKGALFLQGCPAVIMGIEGAQS